MMPAFLRRQKRKKVPLKLRKVANWPKKAPNLHRKKPEIIFRLFLRTNLPLAPIMTLSSKISSIVVSFILHWPTASQQVSKMELIWTLVIKRLKEIHKLPNSRNYQLSIQTAILWFKEDSLTLQVNQKATFFRKIRQKLQTISLKKLQAQLNQIKQPINHNNLSLSILSIRTPQPTYSILNRHIIKMLTLTLLLTRISRLILGKILTLCLSWLTRII